MFHIAFYVPEHAVEKVKESMFAAGAGKLGFYHKCAFEYKGIGQFEPLPGSRPYIGSTGDLEKVSEIKVEMVCEKQYLNAAILALRSSHPYETPAYYVIETVGV